MEQNLFNIVQLNLLDYYGVKTRHIIIFLKMQNKSPLHSQKVSNGDGLCWAGCATGFFRVESAVGLKSELDLEVRLIQADREGGGSVCVSVLKFTC